MSCSEETRPLRQILRTLCRSIGSLAEHEAAQDAPSEELLGIRVDARIEVDRLCAAFLGAPIAPLSKHDAAEYRTARTAVETFQRGYDVTRAQDPDWLREQRRRLLNQALLALPEHPGESPQDD
ncbi:hypothetical protein COU80_04390 [Candidatus Peregrinibacteria bacterium CG10_big_fil_rev_8_21_14_0_10_55_24]|nr:MAG: hypothetical protein COU80_04390 [Candidatus Peregrinibacteria bacterium CG10_big_fil_rev_8_21_14_0_10_55_24]